MAAFQMMALLQWSPFWLNFHYFPTGQHWHCHPKFGSGSEKIWSQALKKIPLWKKMTICGWSKKRGKNLSRIFLLPSKDGDHIHRDRENYRRVLFWGGLLTISMMVIEMMVLADYIIFKRRSCFWRRQPEDTFHFLYLRIWSWGFQDISICTVEKS